ncbi:hypothetical protein [Leadbettera azotonutricia]|uniref:MxaA protein n=1 Tax=Leadbettera azotonutricia (strain ATCC BAA-888 / DSM 13862 / ZAS-9) TaxID=545695 RepID=F5Y7R0_LEAAZ|nr:hypothetical protein [Leadbettera azotonutricia]AEF81919.1 hypothetical protein TREAZ_3459 [Leadbettera azotonutricia ZAS-9]
MKRQPLVLLLSVLLCSLAPVDSAWAQDNSQKAETPYLIPQTIFVGDSGRLVVQLGQAFLAARAFAHTAPELLPKANDVLITRIELEQRNGTRLLIDFIPYAPGIVAFPDIEIPSSAGEPLQVSGLEASVASILRPQEAALAEPAAPLTVPGTGLLVYGAASGILALVFLGIGGSIWGRKHFSAFRERWRRKRLLRVMDRFLRRLRVESEGGSIHRQMELFSLLSGEFREFLSIFTGVNCRILTPLEFRDVSLAARDSAKGDSIKGDYLCDLFRRWETLRFSGSKIAKGDLRKVLDELNEFILSLAKTEKAAS